MEARETVGKILIEHEQIIDRAKEIGRQISNDFKDEEIVLVGILKGSVFWLSDVAKNIDGNVGLEFMAVSSYGKDTKTSGTVKILKDIDADVSGKNVIIVEDIVDSGITLSYLTKYFANKNAKEVRICTLLDKPSGRRVEVGVDYIGFTVEDLFIVGYGLDFDQKYRHLPYISYLEA